MCKILLFLTYPMLNVNKQRDYCLQIGLKYHPWLLQSPRKTIATIYKCSLDISLWSGTTLKKSRTLAVTIFLYCHIYRISISCYSLSSGCWTCFIFGLVFLFLVVSSLTFRLYFLSPFFFLFDLVIMAKVINVNMFCLK